MSNRSYGKFNYLFPGLVGNNYLLWDRLKVKQVSYGHCLDFTYCLTDFFGELPFGPNQKFKSHESTWRLCSSKVVIFLGGPVFLGPKAARFMPVRDGVIPRSSDKWRRRDWSKIQFSTLKALNPLPVFHALRTATSRTAVTRSYQHLTVHHACPQLNLKASLSSDRIGIEWALSMILLSNSEVHCLRGSTALLLGSRGEACVPNWIQSVF